MNVLLRKISCLFFLFFSFFGSPSAWAEASTYVLDSDKSTISFQVKSTLHEFSGTTHDIKGKISIDLQQNRMVDTAEIAIPVMSMQTGITARDHAMQHMFEVERYPQIDFRVLSITPLQSDTDSATGTLYEIRGTLKIRRIEREVFFKTRVFFKPDAPDTIKVEGETTLKTTWFDLVTPAVFGIVRVNPNIRLILTTIWKRQ